MSTYSGWRRFSGVPEARGPNSRNRSVPKRKILRLYENVQILSLTTLRANAFE